jgi:hypothetical protein
MTAGRDDFWRRLAGVLAISAVFWAAFFLRGSGRPRPTKLVPAPPPDRPFAYSPRHHRTSQP